MAQESNGNLVEDWRGFLEEFQKETPRAAAILGASFLDECLRLILSNFMIDSKNNVVELLGDEKSGDRPLGSFSSRIKAAYCLGLISKRERDDLNQIRRIRNKFAHRLHGLTFDDGEIEGWCTSLSASRNLPQPPDSSLEISSPRGHFNLTVVLLMSHLRNRAEIAKGERRKVAKDLEYTIVDRRGA